MTLKRPQRASLDGVEVSAQTLAGYLGLVPNSIIRLATESGLPRTGRGLYPLGPAIAWYLARLRQREFENPGDLQDERRKLITSQREGQDLANAQARAAMLDASLVATALRHLDALIIARLDAIPSKVVTEVGNRRDAVTISRIVSSAAYEARRLAAADVAAFAASLSNGPDA